MGRGLSSLALVVAVGAWAPPALAQTPPPAPQGGAAQAVGEAPGGAPLAPLPAGGGNAAGTPSTAGTPSAPAEASDPASERRMTFAAGGSECRETVPGGTMLAIAYAVTILVIGLYVALLARKNAKLTAALEELEAELARRRPAGSKGAADEDA